MSSIGQELTIFREIKKVKSGDVKGELVTVRGTAPRGSLQPEDAHGARAAHRVARRGRAHGQGRRGVAAPRRGAAGGRRGGSRGEDHRGRLSLPARRAAPGGVPRQGREGRREAGQRFFAVRRGDRWLQQIGGAGRLATVRPRVQDERPAQVDEPKFGVDEELLPDETYAELRVVHVRERTAAALVTHAMYEVERDAVLVSRKGL